MAWAVYRKKNRQNAGELRLAVAVAGVGPDGSTRFVGVVQEGSCAAEQKRREYKP